MENETRKERPLTGQSEESIRRSASNVGSAAQSTAQNIGHQAQQMGNRASDVASNIGNRVSDIADQVGTTLEGARRSFNDARDVVADKTRVAAKATDDFVVSNPWKAVGIASGIALVVGLMLRRR